MNFIGVLLNTETRTVGLGWQMMKENFFKLNAMMTQCLKMLLVQYLNKEQGTNWYTKNLKGWNLNDTAQTHLRNYSLICSYLANQIINCNENHCFLAYYQREFMYLLAI